MASDLIQGLNEQQRMAVTAGEGPTLVLAGPGSGKTRVLIHRVAYLIREMGVWPQHIMGVTFTNKAAAEMRQRAGQLLGERLYGVQLGTFHATCARLLRREADAIPPYTPAFVIYDNDDQIAAVKRVLSRLNIDNQRISPRGIVAAIARAKTELIRPEDFIPVDYTSEIVARVYAPYQQLLRASNAMDFGDLLMNMVYLMRESEEVRRRLQERFAFILVDEFQDTNMAQYELVRLFAAPQNNVFVVGDEDQAIYAFRGADYRNVMRFREDFPDAHVILLEENYRSTQIILDVAHAVINQNRNRTPKNLFTRRGGGERITISECYNENYEGKFIAQAIEELRTKEGWQYRDFAVMYRTNAQSRAIEDALIQEAIPYRLVGAVGFYQRREIRDLVAYLRAVHNPNDEVSLARIINTPKRGIGEKTFKKFRAWVETSDIDYTAALETLAHGGETPLSGRAQKLFTEFAQQWARWRLRMLPGQLVALLDEIMADVGYNLYLHEISDTPEQALERTENIRELRALLHQFDEDELSLSDFLAEQSLVSDIDRFDDEADAVTLLTLHAAKGLEFSVVFLTGLEEGLLPHSRAFEETDGVEEERRLFYVGVTRAKERLYLTYAFRRSWSGETRPSSFLSNIPKELTTGFPLSLLQNAHGNIDHSAHWSDVASKAGSALGLGRLKRDLARGTAREEELPPKRKKIRRKIVPFPAAAEREAPTTKFRPNMRVRHPIFGEGTVIESRPDKGDELVTVAFNDRNYGVRKLFAHTANLTILSE